MARRLITFATQGEAAATILRFRGVPQDKSHWLCMNGYRIVVTGVGTVNAAAMTARYLADAEEVWNVGVAGTFHGTLRFGEVVSVRIVRKHMALPANLDAHSQAYAAGVFPEFLVGEEGEVLLTSDYPIRTRDDKIEPTATLVDMEGYGVVAAARLSHVPCRLWKAVSDEVGTADAIAEKIPMLSERLASFLAFDAST